MTPSLGLVFALFLLAPGFGFYAGLTLAGGRGGVQAAPPPPGSLFALVLVGIAAIVSHAVGVIVALLNDAYCADEAAWCLRFRFNPNFYVIAADLSGIARRSAAATFVFLWFLLFLTALAYATGRMAHRIPYVRYSLYGWFAETVERSRTPDRTVIAYVLSSLANGGARLGYEGTLVNITLDGDREIRSLVMREVQQFTLTLGKRGEVTTRSELRASRLPVLHLDRAQIANVVFEVFDKLGAPEPRLAEPRTGLVARGLDPVARLYAGLNEGEAKRDE